MYFVQHASQIEQDGTANGKANTRSNEWDLCVQCLRRTSLLNL